jgi:U3 small nucleolar RNA-associated protein 25
VAAAALERRRRDEAGESDDGSEDEEEEEDEEGEEDDEGSLSGSGEEEAAADGSEEDGDDADDEDAPMVVMRRPGAPRAAEEDDDDVAPPSGDAFSARLEAVLSDADVAALAARRDARATWRDAGAAPLPGAADARWELDGGPEGAALPVERNGPGDYPLPAALLRRWAAVMAPDAPPDAPPPRWASPLQRNLFAMLDSYRDVLYTARELPPAPPEARPGASRADAAAADDAAPAAASDEVMDACLLHALSHVLKTRSRILHNTELLRKRHIAAGKASSDAAAAAAADVPQDQGFTRPKVLLLLPLRSSAKRWLDRALQLLPAAQGAADAVSKKERYEIEYGARPDESGPNPRSLRGKPPDFRALFAGNRDDHFRMGVKLTRKSVRLFADFSGADLIIASPLGLATRLDAGDASFLSSIELVIADGCDVMLMQNWAHVGTVFGSLNALPSAATPDCEIMRVRPWYLNGHGAHYRQSVLLSRHGAPQLAALLRESCSNAAGRARTRVPQPGVLASVLARGATQQFTRVLAPRAADAADARFAAFKTRVWPRLRESRGGELLFVPSYFDFVRLRNFLKANDASFMANSEYADASDVGRGRADFFSGAARIMLYSERAHFFRRHTIRGAKRITFYAPPECAEFYPEIVNAAETSGAHAGGAAAEGADVALLFTRWDGPALERLVGSERAARMLRDTAPAYIFC